MLPFGVPLSRQQADILDSHLMAMLAAAEPAEDGELGMPPDMPEPRFSQIGSGLYAEIRGEQGVLIWQSRSTLGLEIPAGVTPQGGDRIFAEDELADGTPLLTFSIAVQWEFPDGELRPYVFKVAESLDSYNAQIAKFRGQLFGWFAAVALIMLLAISILMRRLLRPLRQVEAEIEAIEEGTRSALSDQYPTELQGVAKNMNLLINNERARSDRYRVTLDNLAHSLKTPLAAIRALLDDRKKADFESRANEQIDRMDEIVRYQLRKPAANAGDNPALAQIDIAAELGRLVAGLKKVHHQKAPTIDVDIDPAATLRADAGDFHELAGNLIDNACKWCNSKVAVRIEAGMRMTVSDDGPGIPGRRCRCIVATRYAPRRINARSRHRARDCQRHCAFLRRRDYNRAIDARRCRGQRTHSVKRHLACSSASLRLAARSIKSISMH